MPQEGPRNTEADGARRLLGFGFLLAAAINTFFSLILILNWSEISFLYIVWSKVNIVVFSDLIDKLLWAGSLTFLVMTPHELNWSLRLPMPRWMAVTYFTSLVSLMLVSFGVPGSVSIFFLAVGAVVLCCEAVHYASRLLFKGLRETLTLYSIGILSILTSIELGSAISYVINGFHGLKDIGFGTLWLLPRIELHLSNALYPAGLWLLIIFIFSWAWIPILNRLIPSASNKPLHYKGAAPMGRGEDQPSRLLGLLHTSTIHWPELALSSSILLGIFLAYFPQLFSSTPIGLDVPYYVQRVERLAGSQDLWQLASNEPRPITILFLWIVNAVTFQPPAVAPWLYPAALASILAVSTYTLTFEGTSDRNLAAYASILTSLSIHTTLGIGSAIYANWLALTEAYLFFTLSLKASRKASGRILAACAAVLLLIFFTHLWTFLIVASVFASYALLTLILKVARAKSSIKSSFVLVSASLVAVLMFVLLGSLPMAPLKGEAPTYYQIMEGIGLINVEHITITLQNALSQQTGGFLSMPYLFIFATLGMWARRRLNNDFNRLLFSWVLAISILLAISPHWLQWRLLYMIPFEIPAALGVNFISDKARASISIDPQGPLAIGSSRFSVLLKTFFVLLLFNYAMRCNLILAKGQMYWIVARPT